MRIGVLLLLVITGCNHRHFHLYETAPDHHAGNGSPTQGIYALTDFETRRYYGEPHSVFLYEDGTAVLVNTISISSIPESEFWSNPEEYLKNVNYRVAHAEGIFLIEDGKIAIEVIGYKGGVPQLSTLRYEGLVKDSTIQLTRQICHWCPDKEDDYPKNGVRAIDLTYRFYQTDVKPDSSDIWLKKTRWYQKGRYKSEHP